ncbi:MAG: ATP synthase subunit C [Lachnospiraceae bacterium]|nr:ATP synthase subunit C [Lachnospiraceae bacterium]
MALATQLILVLALILSIFIPFGYYLIGEKNKKRYKKSLAVNVFFFFGTMVVATILMFTGPAAMAATTATSGNDLGTGLGFLAAALATGLSCVGGGVAVAGAASAALGAISEDSSVFGKSLIYVGLAEGVCLYGLIISFMILGRL